MRGYVLHAHDLPDLHAPDYIDRVQAAADFATQLRPWTLVPLPKEDNVLLVASRRSTWWRLVTWWLNVGRRRERARQLMALAHHFSPGQVAARVRASQ